MILFCVFVVNVVLVGLVQDGEVEGQVHHKGAEGHDEYYSNFATSSILLFDPKATSPKVKDKVYKSQKEAKNVN